MRLLESNVKVDLETIYLLTGRTELDWNMQIDLVHHGEDGPGYDVNITRSMFIADQNRVSAELSDWYYAELMDEYYFE